MLKVAVLAPSLHAVKLDGCVVIAAAFTVNIASELVTEEQPEAPETITLYLFPFMSRVTPVKTKEELVAVEVTPVETLTQSGVARVVSNNCHWNVKPVPEAVTENVASSPGNLERPAG